jgi:hypothetical protein
MLAWDEGQLQARRAAASRRPGPCWLPGRHAVLRHRRQRDQEATSPACRPWSPPRAASSARPWALVLPALWWRPDHLPGRGLAGAAGARRAVHRRGLHPVLPPDRGGGPARALAVTFVVPVFAVLYGVLFLGEHVTAWMLLCAAVIVCGTRTAEACARARRPTAEQQRTPHDASSPSRDQHSSFGSWPPREREPRGRNLRLRMVRIDGPEQDDAQLPSRNRPVRRAPAGARRQQRARQPGAASTAPVMLHAALTPATTAPIAVAATAGAPVVVAGFKGEASLGPPPAEGTPAGRRPSHHRGRAAHRAGGHDRHRAAPLGHGRVMSRTAAPRLIQP